MERSPPEDRLHRIARALSRHSPRLAPDRGPAGSTPLARASVAVVLRPAADDLELLIIKRATRVGDPWSGHMALPGGRTGPDDADARATAERETFEEVGIDLRASGTLLGRLDDTQPVSTSHAVLVSAFVFATPEATRAVWNDEVDTAMWVGLDQLAAPAAAAEYRHSAESGDDLRFPAIVFQEHVIWGITFHIITAFLGLIGHAAVNPYGDPESPRRRTTRE